MGTEIEDELKLEKSELDSMIEEAYVQGKSLCSEDIIKQSQKVDRILNTYNGHKR